MQFSLASLFVLVAIAAVLCRLAVAAWDHWAVVREFVWLLAFVLPFSAGALMAWVKGFV